MTVNRTQTMRKRRRSKPTVNGHGKGAPCGEPPESPLEAVGDGAESNMDPLEKVFWQAALDTAVGINPPPAGTVETVTPEIGKDPKTGQFVAGNKLGRGNPHARRQADFHRALMDAVTPAGVQALAVSLWVRARGGDVQAAALLLSYVVGKPRAAPDPDRLDLEECHLLAESPTISEVLRAYCDSLPPVAASSLLRMTMILRAHRDKSGAAKAVSEVMSREDLETAFVLSELVTKASDDAELERPHSAIDLQLGELRKTRCRRGGGA